MQATAPTGHNGTMKAHVLLLTVAASLILLTCPASAAETGSATNTLDRKTGLNHEWQKWFGAGETLNRLAKTPFPVHAVVTTNGQVLGWVFRTDQVPPVVKGKRGEIGVMVGLGTDGLIKGVQVVETHEDAHWFSRLTPGFYAQFNGKAASRQGVKVDTVSGATVSSHAIVEDVFLSSQTVLSLPEVNPLLKLMPAKQDK